MKDKIKLNHSENYGAYIQRLAKKIKYLADDNLSKHNITLEQVKIIGFLDIHSNAVVYQKDIETEFGIKRSSVTSIMQNLEKNGLITREGDQSDARIKKVQLTEKGRMLSRLLKDYIESLETVIVTGMTEEEKELFLYLLKKSLNNVDTLMKGSNEKCIESEHSNNNEREKKRYD